VIDWPEFCSPDEPVVIEIPGDRRWPALLHRRGWVPPPVLRGTMVIQARADSIDVRISGAVPCEQCFPCGLAVDTAETRLRYLGLVD
jgi:hypothetical protein